MSETAIETHELGKRYRIGELQRYKTLRDSLTAALQAPFRRHSKNGAGSYVWALKDVSVQIKHGEAVGVIGRNGAGKTTLLKILSRITEPTSGHARIHGRVGSLLEVGTGFHPELTGRENVYLNGAILGMRKAEIEKKFDEIVAFSEVEKFIDTPVKFYSSGMYVRLAFAVAAHLEPEILLVDEVLAVGDAAFQKKCLGKMGEVATAGRTVLFVSHNMSAVRHLCARGIWIDNGRVRFSGKSGECVDAYIASYEESQGLEAGVFQLESRRDRSGNGKVRCLQVHMAGADGAVRNQFEFCEPFEITFDIEAKQQIPPFFLGFTILSSDGASLFSSHHPDSTDVRGLEAGERVQLTCSVYPNTLKPGRYLLQIGIADLSTWDSYDWFYAIGQFSIEPGSGKFQRHLDGRPGYMQPLLNWKWRS